MAGGVLPAVASVVRTVLLPTLITSKDITCKPPPSSPYLIRY